MLLWLPGGVQYLLITCFWKCPLTDVTLRSWNSEDEKQVGSEEFGSSCCEPRMVKCFQRGNIHAYMQSYSWKLFLQFLSSPLVLETLPGFWIHLLRAAMLLCRWTSDKTYPNPALVFCMGRVWASRVCFSRWHVRRAANRVCHRHLPRTGVWMSSSEVKEVNSNICKSLLTVLDLDLILPSALWTH